MNKVVARYRDGRLLKGITADFSQTKDLFHVRPVTAPDGTKPVEVHTDELKALFFVKDYDGLPERKKTNDFDSLHPAPGRRIQVKFSDGESLVGTTMGFQPGRPGFFLVPADAASNTERCFVVAAATREISFIRLTAPPAAARSDTPSAACSPAGAR